MFRYIRAAAFAYVGQQYFSGDNPFNSWKQSVVLATTVVDPGKGAYVNFLLNGIDTRSFNNTYRSALYDASNYYVGRKLERLANKNGLSLYELNVLLSVNSDIGKAVAGTAYREKNGKVYITGFMSRSKPILGLIWDVNDTLLGYQGLLDSVSRDYIKKGKGRTIYAGHSLGALRSSNLVGRGYAPSASVYSLPFGNAAPANVSVINGGLDLVNGGFLGSLLNPHAKVNTLQYNHFMCSGYKVCP